MSEHEHPGQLEHKKPYVFFVDAKRYETEQESITGAEIKKVASVPAGYQLFEEVEGDHPDKQISDTEAVDLRGKIKHFYAVPPATFGRQ